MKWKWTTEEKSIESRKSFFYFKNTLKLSSALYFMRFKWNPKNHSQYKYKRRVERARSRALKTFLLLMLLCGRMGGKWGWKFALHLKGGKQLFHHFPAATDTYIWNRLFSHPLLPLFALYVFTPAAFVLCSLCREHGLYTNAILACETLSLFLEFYPHALYIPKKA